MKEIKNKPSTAFYVYMYRDPSRNNEPIYIGKGKNNRSKVHMRLTGKSPLTNRLKHMLDNNIQPIIEYLIKDVEEDVAFENEIKFIMEYGRKDLGRGPLLNLTAGGDGVSGRIPWNKGKTKVQDYSNPNRSAKISAKAKGRIISEDTKLAMSIASKGKSKTDSHKKHIASALSGRKLSEEHRRNLSIKKKGIILPEDHKLKIRLAAIGKKRGPYKKKFV